MSKASVDLQALAYEPEPWGVANPRRGIQYHDHAKAFVEEFPVGSDLTPTEFDNWLERREMVILPAEDASKNSDSWLAHLQRRHQHLVKLNKAAMHPRMRRESADPFQLTPSGSVYEVRSLQQAISRTDTARKIDSLATTKLKQLNYLLQSEDFSALPPSERAMAIEVYEDIKYLVEDTNTATDRISRKLLRLEKNVRQLTASGEIKPRNGGIQQLLSHNSEE